MQERCTLGEKEVEEWVLRLFFSCVESPVRKFSLWRKRGCVEVSGDMASQLSRAVARKLFSFGAGGASRLRVDLNPSHFDYASLMCLNAVYVHVKSFVLNLLSV